MWRRILLISQKEGRHIIRDFRTVYLALGIPLVMLLLFGYALTMDVEDVPLLVIDGDHSPASRELAGAFEHSGLFTIVGRPDDPAVIMTAFRRSEAQAALILPAGFGRDRDRGQTASAQLILDGTNANIASIAMGYAAAISETQTVRLVAKALSDHGVASGQTPRPPIDVRVRNWFNGALRSQWYLVPGLIAIIMAMMSALLMALTVAREWERGTMEQLLATPVHPLEIVVGKLLPYFIIGLGQLTLVGAAGTWLFAVPVRGSLLLLNALSSLFLIGALGQGLLISVITRQQQLAMQLALMTSMLPALLLSGFMSPIASMPAVVRAITYVIPARYFLVVLRGLFLKGVSMDALWPEALALVIFATVMLTLATLRFRPRIEP
jgi:ABC-2 type transport system permease protein